jgi:hypothetical protein
VSVPIALAVGVAVGVPVVERAAERLHRKRDKLGLGPRPRSLGSGVVRDEKDVHNARR